MTENGMDTKLFDLAKSVHWIVDESHQYTNEGTKRRRILPGGNDDSDDETNNSTAPVNDIYRLRQQKKFNK
jgi:cleavage stimulation factor subunit 3